MSRWIRRFIVAVRGIVRPGRIEHELDEEMQFHIEREIQERIKDGLAPDEARYAALRAMGAIEKSKEECRDLRAGQTLSGLACTVLQDLRYALRLFRRHPGPVGIALMGLALAIGVATSVFSIVNASLLKPYGMDLPSTVIAVGRPGQPLWVGWPYPRYLQMRERSTLAAMEASLSARVRVSVTPSADGARERPLLFVSGGYLAVLGGKTSLGRALGPTDDTPGSALVIVVSDHFWRTELDSDPAVVGKTVWLDGTAMTVAGVMRPDFTGPVREAPAIWTTFAAFDDLGMGPAVGSTSGPRVEVVGRLLLGVSAGALQEQLRPVIQLAGAARPEVLEVYSAASPIVGPGDTQTVVVLACILSIVGLILALACANTANLLMASAVTRRREVGVRLAMGASRGRLVRQMVTESLLLGLMAGGLGFLVAFWLSPAFGALVEISPAVDLTPDVRVLLFTLAVASVCGLGAGLSPARHGVRGNVLAAVQSQSGMRGRGVLPSRFRTTFVAFQAGVSMLLLVCAMLLARTAIQLNRVEIGFDAAQLLGVSFDAPRSGFDEPAYLRAAVGSVERIASVRAVSMTQFLPFGFSVAHDRFSHGGRSYDLNITYSDAAFVGVTGVRLVRGRFFTQEEVDHEAPIALVSESVAAAFFSGRDPIGQSLTAVPSTFGTVQTPATIIGVTGDALLARVDAEASGTIYRPIARKRSNPPSLLIRTSTPGRTAREVAEALRPIDPRVRVTTGAVGEAMADYLSGKRRLAWLLGPAAVLALVLSALGVYGVTAFVVSQRTEEVGVRMALGASTPDVLRLVIRDSLRPVLAGLFVGLALALVVGRVFAQELGGISPYDPISIALSLATLLGCALVAIVVPARRVARLDPAASLRQS